MSNITNILVGNFLKLTDDSKTTSLLQSNYENEQIADRIFNYSLDTNMNDPYHNLVLIDFGLDWLDQHKESVNNKVSNSGNLKHVVRLGKKEQKYGIFFFSGLQQNEENNSSFLNCSDDSQCLKKLLDILKDLKQIFNGKNAILFLKNIEILEIFFQKEDLALFFAQLTGFSYNSLIRQATIKVKTSILSRPLQEALTIMASSMIQVQQELILKETAEQTTKYIILQLTQKKQTGYSFQQLYKMGVVQLEKGQLSIDKITNVNDLIQQLVEKNEEKDLQKVFNTTFSFQMTQQQKQHVLNLQEINPHFQAMELDHNWNNFDENLIDQKKANLNKGDGKADLIQLEGEDVDQEVEDDDDFDV